LAGVAIADFKQRAGCVDRDIECGAGDQVLVVQVACMDPRGLLLMRPDGGATPMLPKNG